MKYDKIIKWVLVGLFVIGAILSFLGFAIGFEKSGDLPVDIMLYCAYAYALIAIAAVILGVVVIGGMNNPKSLVKLGIGIAAIAVIILIAWALAPGTPAVGYLGDPVSDGTLKLTDTILNLTYLLFGGSLVALVAGWIIGATRK
ncbi:MAG: hypothetical protein E7111_04950 [Bacteroidales bacterium]|nr:hypothetical protein [Bacteroidales bacterium]